MLSKFHKDLSDEHDSVINSDSENGTDEDVTNPET